MNSKRFTLALLLAATASPAFAADADTARQINAANTLVREGKFDEAITGYENAPATSGVSNDALDYNLGVAQYRNGETATAKGRFAKASASSDTAIAAAARYNLGNCFYADAVASAENDKPAAIESLTQAIEHYRGSLAGDPDHTDARANIELAGELMNKLQQEQQQSEQSQDQNSESKQDESKQDESQQADQQQDQDQNQQSQQSEQQQSDSEQQSKQDQASQGKQSQQENAKPKESASKDAEPSQDAKQGEEAEQESPQQESPQQESPQQEVPSGELKPATEQGAVEQPAGRIGIEAPASDQAPMSKEEALKMLQAVRDRDMLRRLRAEQIERNHHVPTDRDW